MNYKLIMLPNPILVSDEEIVCGDMLLSKNYSVFRSEYQSRLPEYNNDSQVRKIIAGIEGLPILDLSVIAEKIGWVDVEKLAISAFQKKFGRTPIIMGSAEADSSWLNTWIDGFKAAQSLNEKKFSVQDVVAFHQWLRKKYGTVKPFEECMIVEKCTAEQLVEKFLSKPKEYNVVVDMEDKIAMDGHTLIGREPKITNNTIKVTKILR